MAILLDYCSLPRATIQGDLRDSDCYAGQQYAPRDGASVTRLANELVTCGNTIPLRDQ